MTNEIDRRGVLLAGSGSAFSLYSWAAGAQTADKAATKPDLRLKRKSGAKPKNILVIADRRPSL